MAALLCLNTLPQYLVAGSFSDVRRERDASEYMMAHNADYQRSLVKGSNTGLVPNWWRVCFVHGDQTKYYRKLYGRKSHVRTLRGGSGGIPGDIGSSASPFFSSQHQDNDQDSM